MTYGDIYNEIVARAYPGAVVPENMPTLIRSWIKRVQRMINRDYNFWFTLVTYQMNTVAGQRSYTLPANFKEVEKVFFTINGQTYTGNELSQLELDEHIKYGFLTDSSETEYPNVFRVDGTNLDFYPIPSSVREFNIFYWTFLDAVPVTPVATFEAYEDDISIYCDDAIINFILHKIKLDQNEWQAAIEYKNVYLECLAGAMQEDKVRRQIPENKAQGQSASLTEALDG